MSFRKKIIFVLSSLVVIAAIVVVFIFQPFGLASSSRLNKLSIASSASQVAPNQTVLIVATLVTKFGYPLSGANVSFSTNLGILSQTVAATSASGQAKTYFSSTQTGIAKVTARYGNMNTYTNVTMATAATTLFSDDFSGTLSKWQTVYNGYGTVAIQNGQLSMSPQASTSSAETHSALVAAGDTSWTNYILSVQMDTVQQLRTGSTPNPWEVGWILFRYQDAQHFYYFIPKTNGIELGKFVNGTQTYLATADTPKLTLNTLETYKIVLKGNNIKISVNGTQVIDYTDASSSFLSGEIGLYDEDAHVLYDNVTVSAN
jgi:hypothetical protein